MNLDISSLLHIVAAFLLLDLLVLTALFLSKRYYRRLHLRKVKISRIVREHIFSSRDTGNIERLLQRHPRLLFRTLRELGDSVQLPQGMRQRWVDLLHKKGYVEKELRRLDSNSTLRRLEAATVLGVIGGAQADAGLLDRLPREPRWFVRLILIHILTRHEYEPALPEISRVLRHAPKWVRQKSFSVLPNYGEALERQIATMAENRQERDLELLFELGKRYSCQALTDFLVAALNGGHATLARRAAGALEKTNPQVLAAERYYRHPDDRIRAAALRSLGKSPEEENFTVLLRALDDDSRNARRGAVASLEEMIALQPSYLERAVAAFHEASGRVRKGNLARVLESRLEYFLRRINTEKYRTVRALIEELARLRRLSVIFGFLERNRDAEVETAVLEVLQRIVEKDSEVAELCSRYLPPRLLEGMGLEPAERAPSEKSVPLKRGDRRLLVGAFVLVLITGPLAYGIYVWGGSVAAEGLLGHVKNFAWLYNYLFVFYSLAINSIYILLLVFAVLHLFRQQRYWRVSSLHLLFARGLLPSISVLAPAYNEERNIVDNVKSLLNLHYPDVEVIVINDGSKDGTLEQLLTNFEMERVDREGTAAIETEPVRGVYISRSFPNLTVVDKVNGGKADSLNAGINLAGKDFICTIDSDSLLEEDALLRAALHTVLTDREPVALGGNIIPANGCTVRNGRAVDIALPRNHLSRFQTIEYMRAFLAGRLGWSLINSMVIISGAFGLFIRKRVVEVGGYLTSKSRHRASTVGEDMELVVRLHEHLRKNKIPYKVYDAFNANCWTEVPERFKTLSRQRDRWHRGLIESVLLHKRMAFNPRYGPVGYVAFPYFIIFELLGPFLEIFGYLNLGISVAFGLISPPVALLLFIAVILYGILVSLGSLLISENEILYFSVPETFLIILYAILENFGFRQVMSGIRVTAYVAFLFKEKSWGAMERKGFSEHSA